jgi:ankyrin repeat protein
MNTYTEYNKNNIQKDIMIERITTSIDDGKNINDLLNMASCSGHIQVVKYLLETYKNIDINKLDGHGYTALHYSSLEFNEIVKILLEYGVNINIINNDGHTPLYYAINRCNLETINLLINNGADVNISGKDNRSFLHVAIAKNRKDIAKILIQSGANINALDEDYKTPLYYACSKNTRYSGLVYITSDIIEVNMNIVEYLLHNGADPNIPDIDGNTVLHIASYANNYECIELLLQYGTNTEIINNEDKKAINMTENDEIIHMIQYYTPVILK